MYGKAALNSPPSWVKISLYHWKQVTLFILCPLLPLVKFIIVSEMMVRMMDRMGDNNDNKKEHI